VPFRHVVLRVCRNALMGQLLTVWRTASNLRRPYLDVRDEVDALLSASARSCSTGAFATW